MRLRRSDPDRPGLTRRRAGRGFTYLDAAGNRVTDPAVTARLRTLAIPPAWRQVWICPHSNGHIQAIGTDEAGRRQYLYHEAWREAQDAAKCPPVARVPDRGRPGSVCRRARAGPGARGGPADARQAPRLVTAVSSLRRARHGNDRLLLYRDVTGWRELDTGIINERFKDLVGDDFTVKDLRTWNATMHAAVALAAAPPPTTKRAAKAAVKSMLEEVSAHLGNTPTVARQSYVDPRIVERYEHGRTIERAIRRLGSDDLRDPETRIALERAVVRLLN